MGVHFVQCLPLANSFIMISARGRRTMYSVHCYCHYHYLFCFKKLTNVFPLIDSHKHKDKQHKHKDHKKDKEREKSKHGNRYRPGFINAYFCRYRLKARNTVITKFYVLIFWRWNDLHSIFLWFFNFSDHKDSSDKKHRDKEKEKMKHKDGSADKHKDKHKEKKVNCHAHN